MLRANVDLPTQQPIYTTGSNNSYGPNAFM